LENPKSKDITKIGAYLKLSVFHENDPRIELEKKENQIV
jgi:hypothetical protein